MTEPRYQDVKSADIPEIVDDDETRVRVICGSFWGATGPVDGVAAEPQYLDVWVPPLTKKRLPVETTRHAFAYIFGGSGIFGNASDQRSVATETVGMGDAMSPSPIEDRSLVVFDRGDEVVVEAGEAGVRFLLVSGKPIREPVAWHGPIVMNTEAEIRQAFAEYRDGSFLKHR